MPGKNAESLKAPAPVRIGMTGEGTYPMVMGGVSTWFDQLVNGLSDHEFAIATLVGESRTPCWDMPANVTSLTAVPMWDRPPPAPLWGRRAEERRVKKLLGNLWCAALPAGEGTEADIQGGVQALRGLALGGGKHRLASTLSRISSVEAIMAAWTLYRKDPDSTPPLTLSQAAEVAHHADRMIAVIDTPWPDVDVIHASSNGPSALLALAKYWSDGTPLLLTEHGVYLRERYLALSHLDWPVRAALMGLIRLICQVTYAESIILAPVSEFNARWSIKLGADPRRVRVVHNGVDVATYVPIENEPTVPTVSFVGRIDPLKDLDTMIQAFALVVQKIPEAKLRLFGPIPEQNLFYHQMLLGVVEELGLGGAVTFEGRVPNARIAAEAGHVVALSSISEGLPFTVIEAMMCARATVSTDVGGVKEITGTDSAAALVVPPRDPGALAEALVKLLDNDAERTRMGQAGRSRASDMFGLELFYRRIRTIYAELVDQGPRVPHGLVDEVTSAREPQASPQRKLIAASRRPTPSAVPKDMADALSSAAPRNGAVK